MSTPSCENCLFWQPMERSPRYDGVNGWCRRYAPQGPVTKSPSDSWQLFPPMNSNQWCGDYRPDPQHVAPQAASAAA